MRNIAALLNPIKRRIGIRYLIDYEPDYRQTIFLAGTARSGTTWVSDIINYANEYRYIFEPFYCRKVPVVAPFGERKYLRPSEQPSELLHLAELVLSGKIRSKWTEQFNRRFIARKRLIKDIRANLFLKWLQTHFPDMPLVLLLRHPCAVALSYARHGWRGALEPLLAQRSLMEDFLYPYKDDIEQARDPFERAVFIWCIETLVPLKQFRWDDLHIIFYEKLLQDPEDEISKLFSFLGKRYDDSILQKLTKPSLTSQKDSAVSIGADPIDSWRNKISDKQLYRALEIVKLFGLDGIYSEASLPNIPGAIDIMNGHAPVCSAKPGGTFPHAGTQNRHRQA